MANNVEIIINTILKGGGLKEVVAACKQLSGDASKAASTVDELKKAVEDLGAANIIDSASVKAYTQGIREALGVTEELAKTSKKTAELTGFELDEEQKRLKKIIAQRRELESLVKNAARIQGPTQTFTTQVQDEEIRIREQAAARLAAANAKFDRERERENRLKEQAAARAASQERQARAQQAREAALNLQQRKQAAQDIFNTNKQINANRERDLQAAARLELANQQLQRRQAGADRRVSNRIGSAVAYPLFGNRAGIFGYAASAISGILGQRRNENATPPENYQQILNRLRQENQNGRMPGFELPGNAGKVSSNAGISESQKIADAERLAALNQRITESGFRQSRTAQRGLLGKKTLADGTQLFTYRGTNGQIVVLSAHPNSKGGTDEAIENSDYLAGANALRERSLQRTLGNRYGEDLKRAGLTRDNLLGFTEFEPMEHNGEQVMHPAMTYVDPDWRKRGINTQVYNEARAQFPMGYKLSEGTQTEDGRAFRSTYDQSAYERTRLSNGFAQYEARHRELNGFASQRSEATPAAGGSRGFGGPPKPPVTLENGTNEFFNSGGFAGGLSSIGSFIGELGPWAIGLTTVAAGFTTAAHGAFDLVKSTAEAEQQLTNLADRLGTSVGKAREWSIATQLVGVDMNALQQAGRSLTGAIEGTEGGSKLAGEALAKLGVRSRDLTGQLREPEAVMSEVLEKLAHIPTQTERVRAANEILGRSGKAFLPLIADYDSLMAKSKELADQVGSNVNKGMTDAQKSIAEFEVTFNNLKENISLDIAPIVLKVIGNFSELYKGLHNAGELYQSNSDDLENKGQGFKFSAFNTLTAIGLRGTARALFGEQQLNTGELTEGLLYSADAAGKLTKRGAGVADSANNLRYQQRAIEYNKSLGESKDEGELRAELEAQKTARSEAIKANRNTVNFVDDDTRAKNDKAIADSTKSIKDIEARLKSLKPGGVDKITEALERMKVEADSAEASLRGGDESSIARAKDKLDVLKKLGATQAQIAQGQKEINRLEVVNSEKETRDRNRERSRSAIRLEDQAFRQSNRFDNRETKEQNSPEAIEANYKEALANSAALRQQQIDSIKRAGDNFGTPKERQSAIDTAVTDEAARNLDAFAAKRKSYDDLAKKDAEDRTRYEKEDQAQRREGARHEYDENIKVAEQLAKVNNRGGSGSNINSDLTFRLQQSKAIANRDIADVNQRKQDDPEYAKNVYQQVFDINKAIAEEKQRDRDSERQHLLEVIELTKQVQEEQQEGVRNSAGGLYDIITGRDAGKNIGKYFQNVGRGVGKNVFENGAATLFPSGFHLDKIFQGQTTTGENGNVQLTTMGKLLKRSPFGVNTSQIALDNDKARQQKLGVSDDRNENLMATHDLTAALKSLEQTLDKVMSGRDYPSIQQPPGADGGSATINLSGSASSPNVVNLGGAGSQQDGFRIVTGGNASAAPSDGIRVVTDAGGASSLPDGINVTTSGGNPSAAGVNINAGGTPSAIGFGGLSLDGGIGGLGSFSLPSSIGGSDSFGGSRGTADNGGYSNGDLAASGNSSVSSKISGVANSLADTGGKIASLVQGTSTTAKIAGAAKIGPSLLNSVGSIFGGAASGITNGNALETLFTGGNYSADKTDWTQATTGQEIGAGLDVASAATLGTLGIMSGIKEGGAQGITKAIGSGSLAIASVDPDPLSKSILGAVGLGSEFISSLFGDPRQNFQNKETSDLERNRYLTPATINTTESSNGDMVSFNQFGQARDTGIQDNFQTPTPYVRKYKDGYYLVDGSVVSPTQSNYTGNNSGGNNSSAVSIQIMALDSQSILDRSDDIGSALSKALVDGHSVANQIGNTILGGS